MGRYYNETDYSPISHKRLIEKKMAKQKELVGLVRIAAAFVLFGSSSNVAKTRAGPPLPSKIFRTGT